MTPQTGTGDGGKPSYKTSTLSRMAYGTLWAYLAALCAMLGFGLYFKLEPVVNQALAELKVVFAAVVGAYIARQQLLKAEGKNGHPTDDLIRSRPGEGATGPGQEGKT